MSAAPVAIVGIAGRFPGANDVAELWENVLLGKTCIASVAAGTNEVGARGVLAGADRFDAAFFGFSDSEARALDPQHRVFLEVCWHALEDAGIDPARAEEAISVFASCTPPPGGRTAEGLSVAEQYQQVIATSPDFLPTRVSYKLGLRGESVLVQTACSSSLVAVHLACESLLSGQSDIALAGGVSIAPDQGRGYPYQEGMISSPTGTCRPFDQAADGTVPGSGAGVVVLRPLDDALASGDRVYAVVEGSAVNNDGATKVGFMAPSVQGQSEVIATALEVAGVDATEVALLEAHGTATELGDQVEVQALKNVFGDGAGGATCALSSLKGSVGHLDRAAGVSGLIRAALCLHHRTIPPAPGSEVPHPGLGLASSPFYLPREARRWEPGGNRRHAGVSSFGVGGTNAHVVLGEAPAQDEVRRDQVRPELVPVSARSEAAAERAAADLAAFAAANEDVSVDAVARGRARRSEMPFRVAAVGTSAADLAAALRSAPPPVEARKRRVIFVFPGHGTRPPRGGKALYDRFDAYRAAVDRCSETLEGLLDDDVRALLLGDAPSPGPDPLDEMRLAQPALLTLEYALARLWESWGVVPDAVLGHSMGEVAAACVAGVFSIEDALKIVAERGRVLQYDAAGAMTLVHATREDVEGRLPDDLDVAAVNGDELTVVSGTTAAIAAFEERLDAEEIATRRLRIGSAAHSRLVEPGLPGLGELIRGVDLRVPRVPIAGNTSGDWVREEMAQPEYWVEHLRRPVRFWDALRRAAGDGESLLLELAPGQVLSRLAEQGELAGRVVPIPCDPAGTLDDSALLRAAGAAWCHGASLDWDALNVAGRPRAALPGYPFDHTRRWALPAEEAVEARPAAGAEGWLFEPRWSRTPPPAASGAADRRVLVTGGDAQTRTAVAGALRDGGAAVSVDGAPDADVTDLVDLTWADGGEAGGPQAVLVRALDSLRAAVAAEPVRYWCVTAGRHGVGDAAPDVSLSSLVALEQTAAQEHPGIQWVDVDLPAGAARGRLVAALVDEILGGAPRNVALRAGGRWERRFDAAVPVPLARALRADGVYLVTGGTGRVGTVLAEAIAETARGARVVLAAREASSAAATARVRAAVDRMESAGATVELVDADVSDPDAVARLVGSFRGRIAGVVHAAGFTDRDRFPLLADAGAADVAEIFAAKVAGAAALADALEGETPDFVLLCSSLSTVVGGLRYGVYAGANGFLDALAARQHARGNTAWLSVAWEAWAPDDAAAERDSVVGEFALTSDEGRSLLPKVLAAAGPSVIVSKLHPVARRRHVAEALATPPPSGVEPPAPTGGSIPDLVRRCVAQTISSDLTDEDRDLREVGADSLRLLQLAGLLSRELSIDLRPASLFHTPTVRQIVRLCTEAAAMPGRTVGIVTPVAPAETHPSTALQRRWLAMAPRGFGYIDVCVRFRPPVDVQRMRDALAAVTMRHTALRTRFAVDGANVGQVVEDAPRDVAVHRVGGDDAQLARIVSTVAAVRFDFERDVPFLPTLVEMPDGGVLLHLHVHHVAFDGTSSTIFLRDLGRAYAGTLTEHETPLQYTDYAAWHEGYRRSGDAERVRAYWRRLFDGAPPPVKIEPDVGGPGGDVTGGVVELALEPDRWERLLTSARSFDTTPFALLVSAFLLLLREVTGRDDLVIGTTAAGRNVPGSGEIVGVFVNPLPVRFDASGDDVTLVRGVAQRLVEFHENQELWLEDVVRDVPPFVGTDLNDTFACYILLQNYERAVDLEGGLRYEVVVPPGSPPHHLMRDFELVIDEGAGGRVCQLWFRRALYSEERVRGWADLLDKVLTRLERVSETEQASR